MLMNTVDYFIVGSDLQKSVSQILKLSINFQHRNYASRWISIINGVRGVPFTGKIGYYTSTFDIDGFVPNLDFVYVSNNAISLSGIFENLI
jgi:hypothetical protein